jgi:nicotinamide-nucleotide amidase
MSLAGEVIARLRERGESVATAESLTGGLLCAALTDIPGASSVVRGGIAAYATDVKATVLGVDAELLAREGAVHEEVARQMAQGVCRVLGSRWGVATTGVAGPEPQDGQPVGTVYVAVAVRDGAVRVRRESFSGGRAQIREASVQAALTLLRRAVDEPEEGA